MERRAVKETWGAKRALLLAGGITFLLLWFPEFDTFTPEGWPLAWITFHPIRLDMNPTQECPTVEAAIEELWNAGKFERWDEGCLLFRVGYGRLLGIAPLRLFGNIAIVFPGVLTLHWLELRLRRRFDARFRAGHCAECGYNLTGNLNGRCPECGAAVEVGVSSGERVTETKATK